MDICGLYFVDTEICRTVACIKAKHSL